MKSLGFVRCVMVVVALTVSQLGHCQEQQNFIEKVSVSKESPSFGEQMYNGASDRLQALVDSISTPMITFDSKEISCLAKNIFFEAGNESEEGKVAVGLVTINRATDSRFANSICGVVNQSVTRMIAHTKVITKEVNSGWFSKKEVQEKDTAWSKMTICQFSWRCMFVKNPKSQDERWIESQRIAQELLTESDAYTDLRVKYQSALYFHSTGVRPTWAIQKAYLGRIGGHRFYAERN